MNTVGIYRNYGALWSYDYRRGDPTLPHAELSEGRCTDVYWNSDIVLSDPAIAASLAARLATRLKAWDAVSSVEWVIGSAYGAITWSYELARQLGARHGFTKKDPADPQRQVWDGRIPAGASVLQCEDVITSFRTIFEVRRAVGATNPDAVRFLEPVAAIVWRPVALDAAEVEVIALTVQAANAWPQESCLLCRQGSPRLRPKAHWGDLIGE